MASLYRVEGIRYAASCDEDGESRGTGRASVYVSDYPILDYTPCGVWIDVYGSRKFVNLRAAKQFASASVAEARSCFIFRKQRQIQILSAQLRNATEWLQMARAAQGAPSKVDFV